MKGFKNLIAFIFVLAMIVVLNTNITYKVDAEDVFKITNPKSAYMQGAGYFDIKWTSAASEGTVKDYKVYVDGKLIGTTTKQSYEYYSVDVKYHTTWVVAEYTDGSKANTATVKFGVTKKGLGLSSSMGYNVDINWYKLGWWYNWGTNKDWKANGSVVKKKYTDSYDAIEFVPMVWTTGNVAELPNIKATGTKYLLGFNEPDLKGQADISTSTALSYWPKLMNQGMRIGSPATAIWPTASNWFSSFMNSINNNNSLSTDFIAIHCYADNNTDANWFLTSVIDECYKKYKKPIWITEFSTSGSNVSESATVNYLKTVMQGLDKRDYVERYAWFSFNRRDVPYGLWYYSTGAWSPAGQVYMDYGNPTETAAQGAMTNGNPTQKKKSASTGTNSSVTKPGKVTVSKLVNLKGKKIKVTVKAVSGAKGYQIRWCDNKKFNGYEEKNIKKKYVTLKGFDKGETYFFKARAYKLDGSKKVWGNWGSVKKIKVKK